MKIGHWSKNWLPVIVWMLVIFGASTDLMSAEHTSRFIGPFLRWLSPEITAATILAVQFVIRKLAHLTEYAVLAALLWRAMLGSFGSITDKKLGAAALLIAATFAMSDEFHQSFVASRTASIYDVTIDTCGAAIGLAIYWFAARTKLRMRSRIPRHRR